MSPYKTTFRPRPKANAGFALIASITIMAVLVLIGVTLYSLSAVATRSADIAKARTEAQANAKAALMLAIGELQKNTGPDTRVTAPADIITDPANPDDNTRTLKVIGAWKSWEGLNHDPDKDGRPITPDYTIKEISSNSTNARFLSWLVSDTEFDAANNEFIYPRNEPDGNTVPLLTTGKDNNPEDGSLQDGDSNEIHVRPRITDNNGRYAWWVSPENQKARLIQPYEPRTNDSEGWMEMGQSHLVPDPTVFGFDSLLNNPEPFNPITATTGNTVKKAINRDALALVDPANPGEPHKRFHDLSTSAVGLLTNTATGGWRKDLSILTEKWEDIYNTFPGSELPLFRYSTTLDDTSNVPRPTESAPDPAQSSLYPWSEYSTVMGSVAEPYTHHSASASWESLVSFATSYNNFTDNGGVFESPFVWDLTNQRGNTQNIDERIYNYNHKQRLFPQIARFQLLLYAKAVQDPAQPADTPESDKEYRINVLIVPIFTLWNPNNVSISIDVGSGDYDWLGLGWRRSPPGALAIVHKNSHPDSDDIHNNHSNFYKLLTPGNFQALDRNNNNPDDPIYGGKIGYDTGIQANFDKFGNNARWIDKRTVGCWLPNGELSFEPGEVKLYSPGIVDPTYGFSGVIRLEEGYDPSDLVGIPFVDDPANNRNKLVKPTGASGWGPKRADQDGIAQEVWFLLRTDRLTRPYVERAPGMGFSLSFGNGGSHFGGGSMPTGIDSEYHNITALVSEIDGLNYWPPDEVDEVSRTIGELASGPWLPIFSMSFGPRMTIGTPPGTNQNRPTKGLVQSNPLSSMILSDPAREAAIDHPANGTFDMTYESLAGMGSTVTPDPSDSEGYIATGYRSADGLSRLILNEIPVRPMASLLELQSWNPRGNNPYPPFQMNLIGNSDATPLIPRDSAVPPVLEPNSIENNLIHDDAYCANHLLFDDWFVSSIAPQGGSTGNNIESFYRDFLTGDDELSNRVYERIPEDLNLEPGEVTVRVQEMLNSPDGWLKIASRLQVDGMFNVNSTSIDAWKALLKHGKSRDRVTLYGGSGIQTTTPGNDHAITRGASAFNVEADNVADPPVSGIGGADSLDTSEYTGFRSLTDAQIDDLAQKIVDQVRLRGPFLSLAEFINRQLSTNDDLALAGTVQTAINNLATDPMSALRDPNNSLSTDTMLESADYLDGMEYEYALAAEGTVGNRASSTYGVPGWIRQADILRPIAPLLSARDDTFTIRAYGDKLDQGGNVIARAWCEAVVKRTRDFCDASDSADSIQPPASPTNVAFGRKYEIVAFRWLNPDEV